MWERECWVRPVVGDDVARLVILREVGHRQRRALQGEEAPQRLGPAVVDVRVSRPVPVT